MLHRLPNDILRALWLTLAALIFWLVIHPASGAVLIGVFLYFIVLPAGAFNLYVDWHNARFARRRLR